MLYTAELRTVKCFYNKTLDFEERFRFISNTVPYLFDKSPVIIKSLQSVTISNYLYVGHTLRYIFSLEYKD
jgi:hypothetical protein